MIIKMYSHSGWVCVHSYCECTCACVSILMQVTHMFIVNMIEYEVINLSLGSEFHQMTIKDLLLVFRLLVSSVDGLVEDWVTFFCSDSVISVLGPSPRPTHLKCRMSTLSGS